MKWNESIKIGECSSGESPAVVDSISKTVYPAAYKTEIYRMIGSNTSFRYCHMNLHKTKKG